MNAVLDKVRDVVRAMVRVIARILNTLSGGKLSPNAVTIMGMIIHLPIAYLIAKGHFGLSAILIVVFGLFDTLDGELARIQKSSSPAGMFLDSVTDRVKEIVLYIGVVAYFVGHDSAFYSVWAVVALGGSVLTSYINAWGEVTMAQALKLNPGHKVNNAFRGGLLRFEVRMFLLIVALAVAKLEVFVVVVGILAWITVIQRIIIVMKKLPRHVQD